MMMTAWMTIIGFALSSSIDNFGVGISYGVNKIRIGWWANGLISLIAFAFSGIGMLSGKYLSELLPGMMSNIIAAVFLFIISARIFMLTFSEKRKRVRPEASTANRPRLGTGYLQEPERADLDDSGEISSFEALFLGVAVSLNALCNGLGAGLLKLSPLWISVSAAVFSFLAIWSGCVLGRKVANVRVGPWTVGQFSTVISGVILLVIGIHILMAQ